MRVSAWAVQKAVYTRLSGSVVLQSADGAIPVYDDVPQDQAYPYIMIGDVTGSQWDTKTTPGDQVTVTIHALSQYRGMSEVKRMLDEIVQDLTSATLDLSADTFAAIVSRVDHYETFLEGDGRTRHGILRFRLTVDDQV